jgi:hypothetical protein
MRNVIISTSHIWPQDHSQFFVQQKSLKARNPSSRGPTSGGRPCEFLVLRSQRRSGLVEAIPVQSLLSLNEVVCRSWVLDEMFIEAEVRGGADDGEQEKWLFENIKI